MIASHLIRLIALCGLVGGMFTMTTGRADEGTVEVVIETDRGAIHLALDRTRAPVTVDNFLKYAESDFYGDTVFHRVIPGFMIQGGGLTADLGRKDTRAPIVNESSNGLENARGTIAMARTRDPDSATSQFFINLTDNPNLDGTSSAPGYTVFGRVIEGMEVVDAIAELPTGVRAGRRDVPLETVRILDVRRLP